MGMPSFMHTQTVKPEKEELRRAEADVAILGVPWEMGPPYGIPGVFLGPRAIRLGSEEILGYNVEFDIDFFEYMKLVDCGDVVTIMGDLEGTSKLVERTISEILEADVLPIIIGGDHTIPIPGIRAIHNHFKGNIGIIHFDSHMDTFDNIKGSKINNATFVIRSTELKRVNPRNIVQIGMSGYCNERHERIRAEELGITTFWRKDVYEKGIKEITKEALEIAKNRTEAVYMTVDFDVLDASYAPVTSLPGIGGLTIRELIDSIRIIGKSGVDAFDICEVGNPGLDPCNITGRAAATVIAELLTAMALGGYKKKKVKI
jgi:agmatinase